MEIRKRNALTALIVWILGILVFVCFLYAEKKSYPTVVLEDLSFAETTGFEQYGQNRMRSMVYEPSLELKGLSLKIRRMDVVVGELGKEEADYPRTLRIYPGNGSYTVYTSDASHLDEGVNRFAFFPGMSDVHELRLDFTGMHGKLIDISRIVVNPADYANMPFIAVAAVLFLAAVMELSMFLPLSGAVCFSAESAVSYLSGAFAMLTLPGMKAQPMFLFLMAAVILILFFLCADRMKGRYGIYLAALLLTTFLLAYWWAVTVPMGEGPDEGMHMDIADYIFRHGVLPRGDDPEIRSSIWGISYAFSPILPFILGAGLMRIAAALGGSGSSLLTAARLVSVLSGTLTVLFAAMAARELFGRRSRMRLVMPLVIAFFPGMMHLRTYVNSDAFGIMTTAMIVLSWARGYRHSWRIRDAVFLAVSLGLCALTYYNCYGFILMSIPFFFLTAKRRGRSTKKTMETAVIIILITFSVCGWWFVRNGVLYHGDLLGRAALRETAERYAAAGFKPSDRTTPKSQGMTLIQMFTGTEWLKETLSSFVGRFSDFRIQVRMPLVKAWLILAAAGVLGNLRLPLTLRRLRKSKKPGAAFSDFQMSAVCQLTMMSAMLIPAVLAVIYSYANDYQPQGRYLMPVIVPLSFFICQGLDEIGNFLYKIVERKKEPDDGYAGGTAGFAAAFASAVLINIILETVYRFYVS